jgi:hypothetical protein
MAMFPGSTHLYLVGQRGIFRRVYRRDLPLRPHAAGAPRAMQVVRDRLREVKVDHVLHLNESRKRLL